MRLGAQAPGLRNEQLAVQAAHHLLVAHGLALQAMRAVNAGIKAGIVLNLWSIESVEDTPARRALIERVWQRDAGWFLDPLLHAEYPLLAWQEREAGCAADAARRHEVDRAAARLAGHQQLQPPVV